MIKIAFNSKIEATQNHIEVLVDLFCAFVMSNNDYREKSCDLLMRGSNMSYESNIFSHELIVLSWVNNFNNDGLFSRYFMVFVCVCN